VLWLESTLHYTKIVENNEIFEETIIESDDDLEDEYDKTLNLLEYDIDPVIQTPEMEEKITRQIISNINKTLTLESFSTTLILTKFSLSKINQIKRLCAITDKSKNSIEEAKRVVKRVTNKYKIGEIPAIWQRRIPFY